MASQAIATVAAVLGTAFARNENGEMREIKAGDTIYEGEVLVTPDGSSVELSMMDGSPLVVSGVNETLLTPDVVAELAANAQEAAASQDTLDELISGIRGLDGGSEEEQILAALEGDGNLDDLLEETAAGLGGGGQGEGHSFVMLDRVNEQVAFSGAGSTDGAIVEGDASQEQDVNLPPQVANVDLGEIDEDGAITFTAQDLLFGSFDPEGQPLTVSNVSLTSGNGTLTDNGDGTFTFTPDADWNGDVSFGFDVTDDLITVPNTATLTVAPVNDAPEVGPITIVDTEVTAPDGAVIVGIPEDGSLIITEDQLIGVTDDIDNTSDQLSVTNVTVDTGTITNNGDGTFTFTPEPDFNGDVVVSFEVSDGELSDTGSATFTVVPVVDIVDDSVSTDEDIPLVINVLGNDSFEGQSVVTAASAPANGTTVINADNTVTYIPNANFNGTDSFTYTVTSGGVTETATVNITINSVVDLTAADDISAGDEDNVISGSLAGNDSTTSGGELSFAKASDPANGSVTVNTDGSYTYTPNANFNGQDSFTYTVTDPTSGESSTQTVTINVSPVADLTAADDSNSGDEDTTISRSVASNDSTTSGGALSFALASNPANGSLTMDVNGNYTYTPDANYFGEDSFTYTVTDAESGESSTQTVTLTVNPVADLFANDDFNSGNEDETIFGSVAGNDGTTSGGSLSFALNTDASFGSVAMASNGSYSYTPNPDYNGSDSFTYTVTDSVTGETLTQNVNLSIASVYDPGSPEDDTITTAENEPVNINVLYNDNAGENGKSPVASVGKPSNGAATLNPDGTITYTPNEGFSGSDSFTYKNADGQEATVSVTVNAAPPPPPPSNNPPVVSIDSSINFTEDATDNSVGSTVATFSTSDPEGDTVTVTLSDTTNYSLSGNSVVLTAAGLALVNSGQDLPAFTLTPNDGKVDGTPAGFDPSVTPINDAPTIDVVANDFTEDTVSYDADNLVVAGNYTTTDPEDDTLTVSFNTASTHYTLGTGDDAGKVFLTEAGINVINAGGTLDKIDLKVSDGSRDYADYDTPLVTPSDDTPTGSFGDQTHNDADVISINLKSAYSDADGDALSLTVTGLPAGLSYDDTTGLITGTIAKSASDATDDDNNTQSYTVNVVVSDGAAPDHNDSFTWTVNNTLPDFKNENGDPVVEDTYEFSLPEGSTSGTTVGTAGATDADGDTLSYSITAGNDDGIFAINSESGEITITKDIDDADLNDYTLTVGVNDGEGGTDTATVNISLTNVDDTPTILVTPDDEDPDTIGIQSFVREAGLASNGSDSVSDSEFTGGSITISDADGITDTHSVIFGGLPASLNGENTSITFDVASLKTTTDASPLTFYTENGKVSITGYSDGVISYTVELTSAVADVDGIETNSFTVSVRDDEASSSEETVTIEIIDDSPTSLTQTSEANPIDSSNSISSGTYNFLTGADGFGDVVFSTSNNGSFIDSNGNALFANGKPLTVSGGGSDTLEVRDNSNNLVMTISLNDDGTYDVTPILGVITSEQELGSVALDSFAGGNSDEFISIDGIIGSTLDIIATAKHISLVYGADNVLIETISVASTVNSNANELGVGTGNAIDTGWSKDTSASTTTDSFETLRLEFYEGATIDANGDVNKGVDIQDVTKVTLGINVFKDAPNSTDDLFTITDSNGGTDYVSSSELASGQYTYESSIGFTWIEISSVTGYGKNNDTSFKIDLLGITQLIAGDPVDMDFAIIGTDGDGDPIDGNISFTLDPKDSPIAIDLDGDGTEYLSRDAGVVFTDEVTGDSVSTAWVAPDDGLLVFDADGSGTVNESKEYVFTEWSETAETDLQAIAEVFDTNQDGVLDAQDENFDKFAVWQDADSDGVTDAGELISLTDLGIESIALTYTDDSVAATAADGDVVIHGQAEVTYTDGSTTIADDTSFAVSPFEYELADSNESQDEYASLSNGIVHISDLILGDDQAEDLAAYINLSGDDAGNLVVKVDTTGNSDFASPDQQITLTGQDVIDISSLSDNDQNTLINDLISNGKIIIDTNN